jgi:hypothetical protein
MFFCQKDHKLAVIGTMSWPECIAQTLYSIRTSSVGRLIWSISWPKLRLWEASSGRNCRTAISNKVVAPCFVFMNMKFTT